MKQQRQRRHDRLAWILQHRLDVQALHELPIVQRPGQPVAQPDHGEEKNQVRDVHLRHPLPDSSARRQQPIPLDPPDVDQARRIRRDQHEQLRRIAEAKMANRVLGETVARRVIDEDAQQRQPAKEVETGVS
ncbi:MAG: hypothetical protein ABL982_18470 [Vicinamibacterales bacterium]